MARDTCNACDGLGWVTRQTTCAACRGRGSSTGSSYLTERAKGVCARCQGLGYLFVRAFCTACNGTGCQPVRHGARDVIKDAAINRLPPARG
jgi:DnaJ-class molecular chaperone